MGEDAKRLATCRNFACEQLFYIYRITKKDSKEGGGFTDKQRLQKIREVCESTKNTILELYGEAPKKES